MKLRETQPKKSINGFVLLPLESQFQVSAWPHSWQI